MALTTVDQGLLGTYAQYTGFKNRIINGDMRIAQRGTAAVTTDGAFPVDRTYAVFSTDGAFSAQQNSSAPAGFVNSLKFTTTTADASLGATQYAYLRQVIEGTNISDLAWGTADAKPVTLSFWARSSLTGTFGGSLWNDPFNRSYPFTYTISVADTWEYKTVTVAGDTTGTWLTTNGRGLNVGFGLGVGSTYSGAAGSWAAAGYVSATGAVSVMGTLNATFYITGVQLEKGSTATSFDYRPYGVEFVLCQRYYETGMTGRMYVNQGTGVTQGASTFYKVSKRTGTPVVALTSGTLDQNSADSFSFYQTGLGAGTWMGTNYTSSAEL